MTWRWLLEGVVMAIHDEQIAEHGGITGVRDAVLLFSALERPKTRHIMANPPYSIWPPPMPMASFVTIPLRTATNAPDFWQPMCFSTVTDGS